MAFLEANNSLSVDPKSLVKAVIEKCLVVDREETRNSSGLVLFWYMDNGHE